MITYIKEIAESLVKLDTKSQENFFPLVRALSEEIDRLDPRDFLPAARFNFVMLRMSARNWANLRIFSTEGPEVQKFAKRISRCLDSYGGDGSRAVSRSFEFIGDKILREIVERDYREISLILLPGGAWKSVIVMSGSILEALLHDQLTKDAETIKKAEASLKAAKTPLIQGKWGLQNLILVSDEIGLLPSSRAASIDQILREYRNFVHPTKEKKNQHPCTEAEALLSKGALDSVCNHFSKNTVE